MAMKYSSESSDEEGKVARRGRDGRERERTRPDDRRRWREGSEDGEVVERQRGGLEKEKSHRDEGGNMREGSNAEEKLVERGRSRPERGRGDRDKDKHGRRVGRDKEEFKDSVHSNEDADKQARRERSERERKHVLEDERRHSRRGRENGNDRRSERKFERERDRTDEYRRQRNNDEEVGYRRDKENGERNQSQGDHRHSRKKEESDSGVAEDSNPKKESASREGKVNIDAANLGKSGGVYIPPFKLARMMKDVQDKSSNEYQRLTWDALRKSINGLVNKVNATNIKNIIPELFAENMIRGRGLFCRSCMKSQMASPGFTDVFAALVAVVNTKFPEVGELLLKRIVLQLKRAYKRNDKPQLLAAVKFIAHLVNQQVADELIALELLTLLLEEPTDDSVEVAVGFVTECGSILQDLAPKGLHGIFERFRGILHEGEIDKRVQFLIEGLFAIRKAKFQGHPAVRPELDLVEQEDQLTHDVSLGVEIDPEITLDIFKPDPNFLENEKKYEELKKQILGEDSEDEDGSDAASSDDDEDDDDEDESEDEEEKMQIKDETETNLINLRRTIYLTIMSSVDFEEAGHKLLKIKLEPGQEMELCVMLLECCSQERTYLRYYGLLGQRFCMINKVHQENFEKCFVSQYSMIHRLETNKLRNVAKFFAHLLGTDALPWHVLAYIRLTEEDTTSSSRIFIKILFQELSEHLGIRALNERLMDPTMQDSFESIFPRDNPKNTRFSINFFTSIGLGGITENLREYLKNMPRMIMQQQEQVLESEPESDDSGSSSSLGSDTSSSESETESSSSKESDRDDRRRKRRKRD
ncbi:pre-mRNA-splicing factor CWC22 [Tripterygium wilfordii]|uniref:Pre-mRNA-splicing factor CWC22 n=1 Tax=Tripterygium wilfordii TaxID=458696 RepID=A0A7J7DNH3_TRIWF|nr:pre-mRNA-splicing factor CWC22 homolog [Tripterygium wilfordii]XP_038701411.1 pre-mRNA-splicing factor CWC22 homolog [Tripterygium wilfordii]KAF5747636.1 pre-mRNA-splicing factor CWC22 [Tripterygium wilfordii]